jgi:hypothetical protein
VQKYDGLPGKKMGVVVLDKICYTGANGYYEEGQHHE